jgi:hypothetical protein
MRLATPDVILAIAQRAVARARALCATLTARPTAWATHTGEPTEWDDRTTLVDVALDEVDWSVHPDGCAVTAAIYSLTYGTPEPHGTPAIRPAT